MTITKLAGAAKGKSGAQGERGARASAPGSGGDGGGGEASGGRLPARRPGPPRARAPRGRAARGGGGGQAAGPLRTRGRVWVALGRRSPGELQHAPCHPADGQRGGDGPPRG